MRVLAAGGRIVADSEAAVLVLSDDAPPAYAFPEADVDRHALAAEAWLPVDGKPGYALLAPPHVEAILEEDEPVVGHPRSLYHRVDALQSSRRVRAALAGTTLAASERPMALFETDEPPRFYFAQQDVRRDLLEPSETVTDLAVPRQRRLVLGADRGRAPPRRRLDVPLPDPAAAADRGNAGLPRRPRERALAQLQDWGLTRTLRVRPQSCGPVVRVRRWGLMVVNNRLV